MIAEFAQIVGLLAAFASGRDAKKSITVPEFLTWLTEHGHEDIKRSIESNHATTISVKAFMNQGFSEVNEKLDYISAQTAMLSSRLDGAAELASVYFQEGLSQQVMDILTRMEKHHAEYFIISRTLGGMSLVLSHGPNYQCSEQRFFQDDLDTMLALGLLRLDYNSSGNPVYYSTRAASRLIQVSTPE